MSTNPSPLKSPGMRAGVGVAVGVLVAVAVAVTVAVGVAVGAWISVLRVARLLVCAGSTSLFPLWLAFTTLVIVAPLGVPARGCTVSVNVAVAPGARGPGGLGGMHWMYPTPPTTGV